MNAYRSPFIVAEIGGNHLGSLTRAIDLVGAAWRSGADAVKFQCFEPEQMADGDRVIESGPWAGRNMVELYRETHTPKRWLRSLFTMVRSNGMVPFASVFHPDDVDFLMALDCGIFKISSFELTDHDLIAYTARRGRPLIISTGMANFDEINAAVRATAGTGAWNKTTLLKCTSAYPATTQDANLKTMVDMGRELDCEYGLSDHTTGMGVAVAAAALGASVIEKHLTINRAEGGADAAFSIEPEEFRLMANTCRVAAMAVGEVRYGPSQAEATSLPLRRPPGGKRGD